MELEIFTLADHAADYGQGKLNVLGTFDTIIRPTYPNVLPHGSIALRIRVGNSEAGKHGFVLKFLKPEGGYFQPEVKGDLEVKQNPHSDYSTLNLAISFTNLKFDKPGKYAIEFHWDGEFRSGLTLNAIQGNAPIGLQKAA